VTSAAPPVASATSAHVTAPAAPRTSGDAVYSAPPPAKVPPPTLPRAYVPSDAADLHRVCARVESSVIALAGVSPEFAHGITGRLQAAAAPTGEVYPVAMYYFIVREAALNHDSGTAAAGLAAAHRDQRILRLKDLPAVETAR
jgi:hypothetical protein